MRSSKLILWLMDKLVFAAILVVVAHYFSLQLQKNQIVGDYQKGLFEKRLTAYDTLLKASKKAEDKCLEVYLAKPNRSAPSEEIAWRMRLAESEHKAEQLYRNSGSSGGSSSWATYDEVIEPVREIETIRRDNVLFLSDTVSKALDQFLNTLLRDLDQAVARAAQKNPLSEAEEDAAWERTQSAYERLRQTILESLRVKEVVLG